MPDLRPIVEHAQVLTLLNEHFSAPVTDLESVDGGSVARVFAFRADDQEYIVRFNLDKMLTWCQLLSKSVDRDGQKLFLPLSNGPAHPRSCHIPVC
ncbi:MAG TPA: hypothetical protein VHZ51_06860 [Ktedonobacteraceae bacterium]|jgi:hypothetical protein|nr:hypothetical protein [Ktedonobacteraceae bacterium]